MNDVKNTRESWDFIPLKVNPLPFVVLPDAFTVFSDPLAHHPRSLFIKWGRPPVMTMRLSAGGRDLPPVIVRYRSEGAIKTMFLVGVLADKSSFAENDRSLRY
ncbi:MAG: hypothetical protein IPK66_07915 [Rhodospirillales bacterium]|nr:hypothetical protein [Rhodospirillales bacterium]